jgi:hypothetical protein
MAPTRSVVAGGRFRKGRPKTGGRRRGAPNRVSREWKDLLRSICEDVEAQEALRRACLKRPELLFKAAEHAFGRPRQAVEESEPHEWVIVLPPGDDIAEK